MVTQKSNGLLVILSGPAGSGKDTVLSELLPLDSNIIMSVSATTRKPRSGEINGKHYLFVSENEFLQTAQSGGFLEHETYGGNFYGTPEQNVKNNLKNGKTVILKIEVKGTKKVLAKMPNALTVFLMPPTEEELERRLRGRGTENENEIAKRLAAAKDELKTASEYSYIIVNENAKHAAQEILNIIKEHRAI